MPVSYSQFASSVKTESAFDVLAIAKRLIADGKDVIELEIGDSPFPSSHSAAPTAKKAIDDGKTRYAPSAGIMEFREAAAEFVSQQYSIDVTWENIVVGPGAKTFEPLFAETFLNPGDGVLVFTPHFPTYPPNIARRGARMMTAVLKESNHFRPDPTDVKRFLDTDPQPKAIFLNTPHNPTGGVATESDLVAITDLIRGRDIALFSDEPYDQMVWNGKHQSPIALPGMIDQCVAAYTFSKSYSMSGWRLGFSVSSKPTAAMLAKLTNTALSCVSPFTQLAGVAVLQNDSAERDARMTEFHDRLSQLVDDLNEIDGVNCLMPGGAFYAFANVSKICRRFGITSHGLALYLLTGANDERGVACLGGECFGEAGAGFLRLSVAEPPERLSEAADFMKVAFDDANKIEQFLKDHPGHRLGIA